MPRRAPSLMLGRRCGLRSHSSFCLCDRGKCAQPNFWGTPTDVMPNHLWCGAVWHKDQKRFSSPVGLDWNAITRPEEKETIFKHFIQTLIDSKNNTALIILTSNFPESTEGKLKATEGINGKLHDVSRNRFYPCPLHLTSSELNVSTHTGPLHLTSTNGAFKFINVLFMYPLSRRYEQKRPTTAKSPSPSDSVRAQKDTNSYMLLFENAQLNTLLWSAPTLWLVEPLINIHKIRPFLTLIGQSDFGRRPVREHKASATDWRAERISYFSSSLGILWDRKNCVRNKKDFLT